ncbi:MAG: hypothetical protein Q4D38_10415 [Planctomycetia bacterium]|nr:hypothetical protein [Planctomycetia bacterium]
MHSDNSDTERINLRDPCIAGFLAWLVPGLGHFYQGRIAKAVLFATLIWGTYLAGIVFSSSSTFGPGRAVYISFRPGEYRLHFITQVWVGLPSLPAVVQFLNDPSGKQTLWGGFMAPPMVENPGYNSPNDPTLNNMKKRLHRYFELGGIFTVVAGLMNLYVIFDACYGPVDEEEAERQRLRRLAEREERRRSQANEQNHNEGETREEQV